MTTCLNFYSPHLVLYLLTKTANVDGMLDPTNKDNKDLPLTIRAVFIIGPDKKLKLSLNCK